MYTFALEGANQRGRRWIRGKGWEERGRTKVAQENLGAAGDRSVLDLISSGGCTPVSKFPNLYINTMNFTV